MSVDRDLVAGEVVIDEEADALVHRELLHQRPADAHRHGADHLAAGGLGIEDAPRRADRQHAPDLRLAGEAVDRRLDEVGAEGGLLVTLRQVAPLHGVFSHQITIPRGAAQRRRSPAAAHPAPGKVGVIGVQLQPFGRQSPQLDASRIDARGRAVAPH